MSVQPTASELVEGVLRGAVRDIARALRWVDDRAPGSVELLKGLYPHAGRAWVVGVTGMPGAGKSTLVDRFVSGLRARDMRVAVIAVDPTSPFSGGAILGDRIRMQRHFLDPGVFIRSLATRGHLGGLTRSAGDVIQVLAAAGYEVILVETVGVGQDELEVTDLADTTVVVTSPGMGDGIQAIKAGILEVADVFAVNKADRDGADLTVRDLQQMIALGGQLAHAAAPRRGHSATALQPEPSGADGVRWVPPIVETVAIEGEGVAELIDACDRHRAFLSDPERASQRRRRRVEHDFYAVFRDSLGREAERRLGPAIAGAIADIAARRLDPYAATDRLMRVLFASGEGES